MRVQVDITDPDQNCIVYSDMEDWDAKFPHEVYYAASKEYGRCIGKIYIDPDARHIGWVFEKRCKYSDSDKTYLQHTWIVPFKKYKVERAVHAEYALEG